METFKAIKNIDWLDGYEVSDYGRVRKIGTENYKPIYYNKNSAMVCEFEGDKVWTGERGRTATISKLMCKAFYNNFDETKDNIKYINGVACDVRLDNITFNEKFEVRYHIRGSKEVSTEMKNEYIDKDGVNVVVYKNKENYFKQWVEHMQEEDMSVNTIRSYVVKVQQFLDHWETITKLNINNHKKLIIEKGQSPKTVNLFVASIANYLRFLSKYLNKPELYVLASEIKSQKIQKTTSLENVITESDLNKLLEYLKRTKKYKWYYTVLTLANTGARVSELITFKVKGVYQGYFEVIGKGNKYRKILIPEFLQKELKDYIKIIYGGSVVPMEDYLFKNQYGEQITRDGIAHTLKYLAEKAGVKNLKSIYPHSFRHYFAKKLLAKTKDISFVSNMLGHESIATTSIYTKLSSDEQKKLLGKLG